MKIALISNMNNNYFALLRYISDLGHEVKLFTFIDEHDHFYPENDTWEIDKWNSKFETIDISYYNPFHINSANLEEIRGKLDSFDILLGSGPSPAYLYKAGLALDFFLPYKTGVEYTHFAYPYRHLLTTIQLLRLKSWQIKGLKRCGCIFNADFREITEQRIQSFKTNYEATSIPLVYLESPSEDKLPEELKQYIQRMNDSSFVVMHHGRHLWKRAKRKLAFLRGPFINNNANDQVIRSFKKMLIEKPEALLVLFEYGPQVDLSKDLIYKLGISENVLWIKKSPRKHILELIKYVDLGIGDIAVGFWGGKLFEFMSNGVPMVNSLEFDKELFETRTGIEIPPFLIANSEEELFEHMKQTALDESYRNQIAKKSKDWFTAYEGMALAKKIVSFFEQTLEVKKQNTKL